ncbi:MAG: pyridoxal phosphate-dependent aminotransferase [Clostridiales bacterium]|nr:pyridoxal phosphate-dependent aminotransferase [Clostridiales bacterium]
MKYDFDRIIDRRGTNSLKWNVADNELPMWVADMDFATAPEIRIALQERLDHGIFGYSDVPDAWYEAYMGWWRERYNFKIQKDWLIFSVGVVASISSIVRKLTTPAEKVLVQSPCYNIFYNSILNNGRVPVENKLIYRSGRPDGNAAEAENAGADCGATGYEIDWLLLEQQLADPQVALMILCNPANPVGKIWSKEELARIGQLCADNHVIVVSDEIHCDLTDPGKSYNPFASVSEICANNSITCVAPTKTFNIAGLQTSAVVVPNPVIRHRVWRGLNTDEVAEPNAFAIDAAIAAYSQGGSWLDELREYLKGNKDMVKVFLAEHFPEITVQPCEATYLMWLNCSAIADDVEKLCSFIRRDSGLYLSYGGQYGSGGEDFIRWNTACPRTTLRDGLTRFHTSIRNYRN